MATLSIDELRKKLGILSQSLRADQEVVITYHRKPLGQLVPHGRLQEERAELHRLRAKVAELEARLGTRSIEAVLMT